MLLIPCFFIHHPVATTHGVCRVRVIFSPTGGERDILTRASVGENMLSATATKNTALGYDASGGRAMQGLVTPLELVVVPYLRPVWANQEKPDGGLSRHSFSDGGDVQPNLPMQGGKAWPWWARG